MSSAARPLRRVGVRARDRVRRIGWRRFLLGGAAVVALVAFVPPVRDAAAAVTSRAILLLASPIAPDIDEFESLPLGSRILATDGSEVAQLDGTQRRDPVRLADLPDHVPRAVMAAEDEDFYDHSGVDPDAVLRAVVRNIQGDEQGGSTITQQLAKLNYTGGQKTFLRKLKEVLYAVELEKKYTKDELLQRYLNQVYFGDGAYGIEAAAQAYFGVSASDLTVARAALLAGKIRAPEALDPRTRSKAVLARRDDVLANMAEEGWLGDDELAAARREPVQLAAAATAGPAGERAPHFAELVAREFASLDTLGGTPESRRSRLYNGGYVIETTLDARAQDAARAAVQEQLGAPGDPTTAVVSVVPGDGAVRALLGGLDANRKFDVASQGRRQTGSAFKPFVYLAGLRSGIDPRSQLPATSPMVLGEGSEPWPVHNYEGYSAPRATIDQAMTRSINTVYAQLALEVGPTRVLDAAEDAGMRKDFESQPSGAVALGGLTEGVSPLEMANAFATFAAQGQRAEPYAIVRIRDREDKVVYERRPEVREAFEREQAGVLNAALQDVVRRGTGRSAAIGRPVAGKTGTTSEYKDAWFVGYVPQLATAVWVGHPDGGVAMTDVHGRRVSGGSFPASIFSDYMREALKGVPVRNLYTASPDDLDLRPLRSPPSTIVGTSVPPSSTTTSPATSTVPPATVGGAPATTSPPATSPGGKKAATTTTTTAPPAEPTPTVTTSTTTTTSTTVKSSSTATTAGPSP